MNKKNSLYMASALWVLFVGGAAAQTALTTPILSSLDNFRDIAGVAVADGGSGQAYKTAKNGVMRTGIFYRSNALTTVSPADQATLDTLGIRQLIDLRTPYEDDVTPESQNTPVGASYIDINVFGTPSYPPLPALKTVSDAETYLTAIDKGFVTNPTERANLGLVFASLAAAPGPVIFNCSSGKDRTGWVAAMLQSIAGVSSSDIMANYLASNTYQAAYISATEQKIYNAYVGTYGAAVAQNLAQAYGAILGVQQADLQAGLNQAISDYGSIDRYLTQGLGLTQAEIYVLRAKMVDYTLLPGQADMTGNAAAGAALLNALQASPLSGHYTAYNYYLQSAIDSGSLGGVQTQIGGQLVADTGSYLVRLPQRIDAAIAPHINGMGMAAGQTKFWETPLAGILSTAGDRNVAASTSRTVGVMVGLTHRLGARTSLDAGLGYDWGGIRSAGADARVDVFLMTMGARYALSSLAAGPFVAGGGSVDVVSVHDNRPLGDGLGTAIGNSHGMIYALYAQAGDVLPMGDVILTPQLGFDLSNTALEGFKEQGSSLALQFAGLDKTLPSLTASLRAALPAYQWGHWRLRPAASISFTRLLSSPVIATHATLQGYGISQLSAFNSRDLGSLALTLKAARGPLRVDAGLAGMVGDANTSAGLTGQLSVSYRF